MVNEMISSPVKRCAEMSRPICLENLVDSSHCHIVVCNALGVGHYQPAKAFVSLLAKSAIPLNITFFSVIRKNEELKCSPMGDCNDNVTYRKSVLQGEDVHPITMRAMISRKDVLIRELNSFVAETCQTKGWGPVSLIVHDPFALFAREWGIQLNIPCVIFNPSNGFFWGIMGTKGFMEEVMKGHDEIAIHSSVPKVRGQLIWNMIENEASLPEEDQEPVLKHYGKIEDLFNHACAVVGNDVSDLYPWALERIRESRELENDTHPPSGFTDSNKCSFNYYCVSPLCLTEGQGSLQDDLGRINDEVSLKYWLDQKEEKSVIYIALGTLYPMKREVVQALFESLKHCPFSFVWSYRELHNPPALTPAMIDSLPLEKGVLLPWVQQKHLLMHPALRLFISHCGWNSTLENMCFGGIPTLCVPLGSDQIINTIMLCDVLRCGRLGMIANEDWAAGPHNNEKWGGGSIDKEQNSHDASDVWKSGKTCQVKYRFPVRAVDFSRLIRETADVYYQDLLLKAKEVQVKVLKAGSYRGDMVLNVERFAHFATVLRDGMRAVSEDYERQRSRVLLMTM